MGRAGLGVTVSEEQLKSFEDEGVLVFPGFLTDEESTSLVAAMDEMLAAGVAAYQNARLRELCWHPRVLEVIDQLIGPAYVFHHIHAARHDAGTGGAGWHHDYLQSPQTNRQHAMVHAFFYLNGLNGKVGDLLVLPGSHRSIMRGDAFWFLDTQPLPGERVFDDVPPGTMILVHSATLHARRARPAEPEASRYFIDSSYCEVGVQWPGYGGDEKGEMLAALSAARGRADDHPELFDPAHFFSLAKAWEVEMACVGSVITEIDSWNR